MKNIVTIKQALDIITATLNIIRMRFFIAFIMIILFFTLLKQNERKIKYAG